jgi:peptidoglycan/xylan/chitin deacetylase (PgdA/CDA1 family)
MEYLSTNFSILTLEEAVRMLQDRDMPEDAIAITFDDGYRDNFVNAFPILKKLSIPATIFLSTDAVESDRVIWHDRVFSAFRETRVPFIEGFSDQSRAYCLTSTDDKLKAQKDFLNFVRSQCNEERLRWLDWLVEELQVTVGEEVPGLMLSWKEAQAMKTEGIAFGSHTVTHPILSRLPLKQVRREITQSKEIIERKLGSPITAFAYPNGSELDFNNCTKALLRDAGYKCAVTTQFGSNDFNQDLFELRRATPWDRGLEAYALRLNWFRLVS